MIRSLNLIRRSSVLNQRALRFGSTRFFSAAPDRRPFLLADIGEGIAEVELMKWFVKEGEAVRSFDRICEVQSDKATVEITSKYDGVVVAVHHEEGAIVQVGSALVDIAVEGEDATPESDLKLNNEPDEVEKLTIPHEPVAMANESAMPMATQSQNNNGGGPILTTPAVRKIAKENNVNLHLVAGSGTKGRILKEDVLAYINGGGAQSMTHANTAATTAPTTAVDTQQQVNNKPPVMPTLNIVAAPLVEDKVMPIRGVQRLMVKSMQKANEVQHLTLGEEISMTKLVHSRKELKSVAKEQGLSLSYMPFLIKAASLALHQYPALNATVNEEVSEIRQHSSHNIGVAMDTPSGLVVPVIHNVQNKSLFDITADLMSLQQKASTGKLGEQDLKGGTFTLSNIGSIAGTYATPVLVVPQVAIGAFGRMQTVPRYVNKRTGQMASMEEIEKGYAEVEATHIMNVSWSADHRVVDGASVAKFSNAWRSMIENPLMLLSVMR